MSRPRSRKWRPPSLEEARKAVGRRELAYVVVDELEANVAGLVLSRWPSIDARGRLRFDLDADVRVAVDAEKLRHLLQKREGAAALRSRPLLVGDVFAARLRRRPRADVDTPIDPGRVLAEPIVDISADAREAAKAQYYAALGGVFAADEIDAMADEFMEAPSVARLARDVQSAAPESG